MPGRFLEIPVFRGLFFMPHPVEPTMGFKCCRSSHLQYSNSLIVDWHAFYDVRWLDVSRRMSFKLCITIYRCLHDLPPRYLTNLCRSLSEVEGRHLRSAERGLLYVPRYELPSYRKRSFSYAVQLPRTASQNICEHLIPVSTASSVR